MFDGTPALFTESEILEIVLKWAKPYYLEFDHGLAGREAITTFYNSKDKEKKKGAARQLLNLFLNHFPGYEAALPLSIHRKAGRLVSISKSQGPLSALGDFQIDIFETQQGAIAR